MVRISLSVPADEFDGGPPHHLLLPLKFHGAIVLKFDSLHLKLVNLIVDEDVFYLYVAIGWCRRWSTDNRGVGALALH